MLFSFIRSALILWITLCLSCLLRLWEPSWLMRFPQSWIETWLGFASTNWQLLLVKPPCLRCFLLTPADIQVASICVGRNFSFWIHVGPYTRIYYCCCTQHLLWMRFCAALTSVTQLSVAVSAPYRGLLHFQSSCVGIMRHTEQLSISTQLVSYHWLQS